MYFLQNIIGRTAYMGVCTILLASITIVPVQNVEAAANDSASTQVLALELETALGIAIINHDIPGFSSMISSIFQGQILSGFIDRNELIAIYSNFQTIDFNLHNLFATRKRDVLVISFNVTGTDSVTGPFDNNVISVWQEVRRHRNCHSCECTNELDKFGCHNKSRWLLVSQTIIPNGD